MNARLTAELSTIVDGVQCPRCNGESHVTDSRDGETSRKRRRECNQCKHRYTTYEIHAEEYERMQAIELDIAQVEAMITNLCAIKARLGGRNGTTKN